ncbi:MAG TPA: amidohydrolase family protein [Candidatus Binataceae bacterium]|nr:amidohydrolase family protein [Candidatus Binataceae bacterium]
MARLVDGDSHFMEPLDLYERYIDPALRGRAMRLGDDPITGKPAMLVDNKPMKLRDVEEVLGLLAAYGQKETGRDLNNFDRYLARSADWQNMDARIRFLDAEEIGSQVIYPSLGIIWEGEVDDPVLADALCRAYNRWAFELVAGHRDRLFPAAHISMRDADLAVREMKRVAALGARIAFVAAMPIKGKSFGHPDFDPIWNTAQELDLAVGLHLVSHRHYMGSDFYHDPKPGLMYFSMNLIQDPRQALTTMVVDGVLERFPRLRVATVEAMVGWVGEWLERVDYRYRYMGHTSQMKRPLAEYFARNIWISGDPEEKMFKYIVQFAGDDKFFIGSDYPHAEGFVHPVAKAREFLKDLPAESIEKILTKNAHDFYRI